MAVAFTAETICEHSSWLHRYTRRRSTDLGHAGAVPAEIGFAIPSWHFLTGPVPSLQAVWQAYHVDVYAPSPYADIVHTSVVYFIDPNGNERFAANPMVDHTSNGTAYLPLAQQASWGQGIALIARQLTR